MQYMTSFGFKRLRKFYVLIVLLIVFTVMPLAFLSGCGGGYSGAKSPIPSPSAVPSAPAGLTATTGNAQVLLNWTASAGASSYNVYQSTTTGGPYTEVGSSTTTSYTATGLANGTTYYFVVTAVNSAGASVYSTPASATPIVPIAAPSAPAGLTATAGNAQVTLNWNTSILASSYNVYQSTTSGGPYTKINTLPIAITTASYTATGLVNGTTYYFVVTAVNSSGASVYSTPASATPTVPIAAPSAPAGLTATVGNAQVLLNWTASAGAVSYSVYQSTTSGGPYTEVGSSITTASYTATGLTNGTTYYFVVTAVNSSGASGNSTEVSATPTVPIAAPSAPAGLTATVGNAQVLLNWTASAGAVSYSVYQSTTSGGPYTEVGSSITTASYTATGLTNGTTYYFVVTAVNSSGASGNSTEVSATPTVPIAAPSAPAGLTATVGNAQVLLNWTASAGAVSYSVYQSTTSGGPYTEVGSSITTASYTATGLTNGTTYYFVVTAVNSSGASGNSTEVSATPTVPIAAPSAPAGLTATVGNAQVLLNWTASAGAVSYSVYQSTTSGGPYTEVGSSITTASYTATGLTNGTTYYFVVTAVNSSGASGNSTEVSATPIAPIVTTNASGSTTTWGDGNYTFDISGSGDATLTAGNGTDTVNITNDIGNNTITLGRAGDTNNDTVNSTTTGNDTITLGGSGATSTDSVIEGNGNNTITVTSSGTDTVTAGNGNNSITVTGSGNDNVTAGQGGNTINLTNAPGTDITSIGQGANIITFGTGANALNLTTLYSTTASGSTTGLQTAGANTLNNYGTNSGDTLVFSHSKDTVAPTLLTSALGSELATSVAATITNLQTNYDTASGDTSVVWTTAGTGNTFIIMDHNTGSGNFVDQVIQIVAPTSYLSATTAVSVNSLGFVIVSVD